MYTMGSRNQGFTPFGGDMWWAPGLTHPCGLLGHVHSLAFCEEFWSMSPMDRHRKLLPGSVCKSCLGPQSLCCPLGYTCTNKVPEELQCSGCIEKAEEWGYPMYDVLFCMRINPDHRKPTGQVLLDAACEYLRGCNLGIRVDMINVGRPRETSVYRA